MKNLLFASVAAFGLLDISTGAGGAAEIPPAAQAAGFTTLALNSDFERPMPKNWLGGCPNGADGSATNTSDNKGHVWYNNIWWKSGSQPCTIRQVADPKYGGITLDIPWLVHYQGTPGGDGHEMQSASWNWPLPVSAGFAAPNNAYYEMVAREDPVADGNVMNFLTWAVTGITGGDPGIEWDVIELSGNALGSAHPAEGADAAIHNWGAGGAANWLWTTADLKAVYPNYDPNAYHAWGLLTISDGVSMYGCGYVDNILIKCAGLPGGLTAAEKTQQTFLLAGTACYWGNYKNSCPLEGQMQHAYIRSIRVWSCKDWATTECDAP
jgi:hypothetical protein